LSDEDEIARIAAEKAIAKIESAPASSES
jgi:hypothetical protein